MNLRKLIPSMFHRRVLLLGSACAMLLCVCFAKAYHLTVVRGDDLRTEAERALDRRVYLPTTRGAILDRHGRQIAIDQASYDLAVYYPVITGDWALRKATDKAKSKDKDRWRSLSHEQQAQAIQPYLEEFRAIEQSLWNRILQLGSITREALDARRNEIKATVESRSSYLWEQEIRREIERYGALRPDFEPMRIAEREQAHVILTRISDDVAFEFMTIERSAPDMIDIQDSHRRVHPWSKRSYTLDRAALPVSLRTDRPLTVEVRGVADHILGSVRDEVWAEDIERRPFHDPASSEVDLGGYRIGDAVGHSGLERTLEDALRGMRGVITERKDTDERQRIDPVPGKDVELTIDMELQGRIQAILSPELGLTRVQPWHQNDRLPHGWKLNAGVVVLDVASGEILAMVSTPSITDGLQMSPREQDLNQPRVNRTVEPIYPPGSIVKPLVLIAAVSDGVHELSQPVLCNGHFFEQHQTFARCWIYRDRFDFQTHGELHASEAIGRSCNIYFYHMADLLGIDRLNAWLHWFGMGHLFDIGLTRELRITNEATGETEVHVVGGSAGVLPSEERIEEMVARSELQSATIFMGIGQGPVAWTPLHAANAYAMLARGGELRDPILIRGRETDAGGRTSRQLPSDLISAALEGLRQSAEEHYGTGNHLSYDDGSKEPIINAPGLTVWAKTGTAQAPILGIDLDGDGEVSIERDDAGRIASVEGISGLDHAWYVGLVGPKGASRPTIAVSVIVEYGGSGGRVAGPIANQVIRALQREGYLPGYELWDDAQKH